MSDSAAWSLHPQLAQDSFEAGDLPLCQLLVARDARYPWLVLVPRQTGAVEIIDLDADRQVRLIAEIDRASRALKHLTGCDKLNVAALGNAVPQLHVHVIARRIGDDAWPRPVWGTLPPLPYEPDQIRTFVAALRRELGIDGS